jgi:hypothetical protein
MVASAESQLAQRGIEPHCLQWVDTDDDAQGEWLGLYVMPADPPRLMAFVMDGETWYELLPLSEAKYGLGEYATCELEILDLNNDGRTEILIWGHAATNVELLHLFVWNGSTYRLLAPFEGNGGLSLQDGDGDLTSEIVVGYRAGHGLVWDVVYAWDGTTYGWEWDRHRWLQLDRPHVYPTETPELAVISFYLAVDDRDLPGAFQLLTATARSAQTYDTWAAGLATTLMAEASGVHEFTRTGDDIVVVAAQVRSYDNINGRVVARLWDIEWTVVRTADGWRLENASAEQLEQWELTYYP